MSETNIGKLVTNQTNPERNIHIKGRFQVTFVFLYKFNYKYFCVKKHYPIFEWCSKYAKCHWKMDDLILVIYQEEPTE